LRDIDNKTRKDVISINALWNNSQSTDDRCKSSPTNYFFYQFNLSYSLSGKFMRHVKFDQWDLSAAAFCSGAKIKFLWLQFSQIFMYNSWFKHESSEILLIVYATVSILSIW
jgi:hypothetical protein